MFNSYASHYQRVHHNFAKGWKILCQAIVKNCWFGIPIFPPKNIAMVYGIPCFSPGPLPANPAAAICLEAIALVWSRFFGGHWSTKNADLPSLSRNVKNYQTLPLATPNQRFLMACSPGFYSANPPGFAEGKCQLGAAKRHFKDLFGDYIGLIAHKSKFGRGAENFYAGYPKKPLGQKWSSLFALTAKATRRRSYRLSQKVPIACWQWPNEWVKHQWARCLTYKSGGKHVHRIQPTNKIEYTY